MRTRMKYAAATLAASTGLALGAPMAAYADGILSDVVADNNVQANVCDTNVNVVASQEDVDKTNCQNKVKERGHGGHNGGNGDHSGGTTDLGLGLEDSLQDVEDSLGGDLGGTSSLGL